MTKTFEEIVNTPQLTDGTLCKVRLTKTDYFEGKVVGLGTLGLVPHYIVECLDGTLPNETYAYKFVSAPLSEIFINS